MSEVELGDLLLITPMKTGETQYQREDTELLSPSENSGFASDVTTPFP